MIKLNRHNSKIQSDISNWCICILPMIINCELTVCGLMTDNRKIVIKSASVILFVLQSNSSHSNLRQTAESVISAD